MTDDAITEEHSYYWPSDVLVPITPQARRAGGVLSGVGVRQLAPAAVLVLAAPQPGGTNQSAKRKTSVDRRINHLLESCSTGLTSRLSADSADEEGFLYFQFKHFYWEKDRDKAKKKVKMKIGCRLLLDPDTKIPWMLLLDPDYDYALELKKGPTPPAANDNEESPDAA